MSAPTRNYPDLHDHLDALRVKDLLVTVDEKIDKDAELHPLVRWAFVGGMKEEERKAFLFTNIVDGKGRKYAMPVVVGAIAANRAIYSIGMGAPVEEIDRKWERAIANPIAPTPVAAPPCQQVIVTGKDLIGAGKGLAALPVPISTPGFDAAPYLTATLCITMVTGVVSMEAMLSTTTPRISRTEPPKPRRTSGARSASSRAMSFGAASSARQEAKRPII